MKATLVSAERLLQHNPIDPLLQDALDTANHELLKQETQEVEWNTIRASIRWAQIDGKMHKDFFLGVQEVSSVPPIQFLHDKNTRQIQAW